MSQEIFCIFSIICILQLIIQEYLMQLNHSKAQAGTHESRRRQQELDTRYNRTAHRGKVAGSNQLMI